MSKVPPRRLGRSYPAGTPGPSSLPTSKVPINNCMTCDFKPQFGRTLSEAVARGEVPSATYTGYVFGIAEAEGTHILNFMMSRDGKLVGSVALPIRNLPHIITQMLGVVESHAGAVAELEGAVAASEAAAEAAKAEFEARTGAVAGADALRRDDSIQQMHAQRVPTPIQKPQLLLANGDLYEGDFAEPIDNIIQFPSRAPAE